MRRCARLAQSHEAHGHIFLRSGLGARLRHILPIILLISQLYNTLNQYMLMFCSLVEVSSSYSGTCLCGNLNKARGSPPLCGQLWKVPKYDPIVSVLYYRCIAVTYVMRNTVTLPHPNNVVAYTVDNGQHGHRKDYSFGHTEFLLQVKCHGSVFRQ